MSGNRQPPVTVVSGLPRSGTSMMMQMLDAGGMPVLADHQRAADDDNRKGYYELEAVKRTRQDPAWLEQAPGKAVKVIYVLLSDLPEGYDYRVVFMRRNMDEILASQQAMLTRRGEQGADVATPQMAGIFARQLKRIEGWLAQQPHFSVLDVDYRRVIADPLPEAHRVSEFLGGRLDPTAMAAAVDPEMYRQRQA